LLLLIPPARDRDQHESQRIENAHPSTVWARVISATTAIRIVFSAFKFLDSTGGQSSDSLLRRPSTISMNQRC
jgi:hypothetical protein